jgi:hypothetical protein
MSGDLSTVGQWLDVTDGASRQLPPDEWRAERIRRQHGLQIAVDVIAHAQNIPIRLFRWERLKALDQTFTQFVDGWKDEVVDVIASHGPDRGRPKTPQAREAALNALREPRHVEVLRDWLLSLATDEPNPRPGPEDLPKHYEHWFLELLPHVEREVWLTDMSNPHPAHSMARMVEYWSLFVLMWSWNNQTKFGSGADPQWVPGVLGMPRLAMVVLKAFDRDGLQQTTQNIWMLVGPFEFEPKSDPGGDPTATGSTALPELVHWFVDPFNKFLKNLARVVPGGQDAYEKAPTDTELRDAFATRAAFSKTDAERRAKDSRDALQMLRITMLDSSVRRWPERVAGEMTSDRPISRANWETIAALCTWAARWTPRLAPKADWRRVHIEIPHHRLAMRVEWSTPYLSSRAPHDAVRQAVIFDKNDLYYQKLLKMPDETRSEKLVDDLAGNDPAQWTELPSAFLARARERQHALWTSQVVAIGNLLARHSRRDKPVGPDKPEQDGAEPHCDEVDHLLRGYAGRICQYVMQMTRAEEACILWLDYSRDPPHLRHVGGAERLIQHRAKRGERFDGFTKWASEPAGDKGIPPCASGSDSLSQLYRALATANIDPTPEARLSESEAARQPVRAFFENYVPPVPQDSIAVPLIFNGRVVGAFNVVGISTIRQFDHRLYAPLRLVAQMLAQAMATQAQLWQMRRLNWLASHHPLELWRDHSPENKFNPLRPVAKTLANIFLCPVVHIWLRDKQNPWRFRLHGYTLDSIFLRDGKLPSAPSFEIEDEPPPSIQAAPLARPFAAFAIDQWREIASGLRATVKSAGDFVQAQIDPDISSSLDQYRLLLAEQGVMQLGSEFISQDNDDSNPRAILVNAPHEFREWAAFALVDSSEGPPQVDSQGANTPVGLVTLHARAPALSRNGSPPWPADWRPMVAHMQAYLPYVLQQTEAIANPLDNMRRYLLHEGRNELNWVATQASELRNTLDRLLAVDEPKGHLRPWLRRNLPLLEQWLRGEPGSLDLRGLVSSAVDVLRKSEAQLASASLSAQRLLSVEHAENLAMLSRMIEHQRDLAPLGDPNTSPDFNHEVSWISPREKLQEAFGAFNERWRSIGVQPDFDRLPEGLEILTSEGLWSLMTRDLVYNVAKYALPHEPIMISWSRGNQAEQLSTLRIRNVSSFDPHLDRKERLGQFGIQGSAGMDSPRAQSGLAGLGRKGQGMGLWGAISVARVAGMPLQLGIEPRLDKKTAHYIFDFSVPWRIARMQAR